MKTSYTHLSQAERYAIWLGLKRGWEVRKIARDLNRAPSTISREIASGTCTQIVDGKFAEVYDYSYGQLEAERKSAKKGAPIKIGHDFETAEALTRLVVELKMSPYAAIKRAEAEGVLKTSICTTTLYSYIKKGVLE
ncbi:MAG: helix-turn-helix domain-containing protein [Bacteroidales bacterium]